MKRATYIGFLFGLVILAAALIPLTDTWAAIDPAVQIPVRCNDTHCLIPKEALMALIEAHNENVDEVAKLKRACGLKVERNT